MTNEKLESGSLMKWNIGHLDRIALLATSVSYPKQPLVNIKMKHKDEIITYT